VRSTPGELEIMARRAPLAGLFHSPPTSRSSKNLAAAPVAGFLVSAREKEDCFPASCIHRGLQAVVRGRPDLLSHPVILVQENEDRPAQSCQAFSGGGGVGKVGKDTLCRWITRG